jgi:hypothetical protein
MNLNPDILNNINSDGTHTTQIGFSSKAVGGRRRRYKSMRYKKSKLRRKNTRKNKSRKHRRCRKQRGGLNPTYRSYSASFEPGLNGIYANGPSVGKIIEQFN